MLVGVAILLDVVVPLVVVVSFEAGVVVAAATLLPVGAGVIVIKTILRKGDQECCEIRTCNSSAFCCRSFS